MAGTTRGAGAKTRSVTGMVTGKMTTGKLTTGVSRPARPCETNDRPATGCVQWERSTVCRSGGGSFTE